MKNELISMSQLLIICNIFVMYKNTPDESINDTRIFLKEIIGSYMEIIIADNKVDYVFYNNEKMISSNLLYDNVRCYTEHSIPTFARDCEILKLFEHICKIKKCKNKILFFALGDFPIIMKNKKKHPHYERCLGNHDDIYPKYLAHIFSRSIIPSIHDDLLFPTRDYVNVILNLNNIKSSTNHDFYGKKNIAVFRGTVTGNDRTVNNIRVQAKMLSLEYPSYLDVGISNPFNYYMYDQKYGPICTTIVDDRLLDNTKYLSMVDQLREYKYILHIDGFVAAWRLVNELFSMSVILKVDSEWIEHYYNDLIPYYHYIPIKSDLSDLIQTIEWCRQNDKACHEIAQNAYNYALQHITLNDVCNYIIKKCDLLCTDDALFDTNVKLIDNEPIKINMILPQLPQKESIQNFNNIKYKYYILPTNKIKKVSDKLTIKNCIPRNELISDELFEKLVENTQILTQTIKKKHNMDIIGNILLDGDSELYENIKMQLTLSITKILQNINVCVKSVNIDMNAMYCNVKNYVDSFGFLDNYMLVFFTKNNNNVLVNGEKITVSLNETLIATKNDMLSDCNIDNDNLRFIMRVKIISDFGKTMRLILSSIGNNIMYYNLNEWSDIDYKQSLTELVKHRTLHICVNVNMNIEYVDKSIKINNSPLYELDLAPIFFKKIMKNYDMISDIYVNDKKMYSDGSNDQYVVSFEHQNTTLKYSSSLEIKNFMFNFKFKLYLFQPDIRLQIFQMTKNK